MHQLTIVLLTEPFAICRLPAEAEVPRWANRGTFNSVTRTADELSIITLDENIPHDVRCARGWRAFKVEGPLEFSLTGVLESVARPLSEVRISIFAVATFDTDYVLVKESEVKRAITALRSAGHKLVEAE